MREHFLEEPDLGRCRVLEERVERGGAFVFAEDAEPYKEGQDGAVKESWEPDSHCSMALSSSVNA